ncbi:putative ankyrin repeat protein RF_0381 [Daphnia carinata]|uniref:putative ankyrin repeat protein RF_0381 n=1 Tax=Daphnia carinata TaxID=120202 RepID=UPI0028689AF7|nr:putative ankyrin repeat protein RF_0381 [Daphnia carinata]
MATFLNERFEEEQTLLHTSVRRCRYDITDLLLSFGADPEILYHGKTIGHIAAAENDLLLLRILKHNNCEFTASNYNGETPLMLVISHENQECTKLIWTSTNINITTSSSKTVLHYLAMYGLKDHATQVCAKRIININQQDDTGKTALHVEAGFNRIDMIEILLLHGADARIKYSHGRVPGSETCSKRAQAIFQKWELNHNSNSLTKTGRKE